MPSFSVVAGFAKGHLTWNYTVTMGWEVNQPWLKKPLASSGGNLGFNGTLVGNGWIRL